MANIQSSSLSPSPPCPRRQDCRSGARDLAHPCNKHSANPSRDQEQTLEIEGLSRDHVFASPVSPWCDTENPRPDLESLGIMLLNSTNVISVGHVVEKLRPILSSILVGSETYVTKKWKKLGSPVRLPLMPPNSSRAYFDPFNETNGAYKDNFFELLHKIINYWGRKGRGGQFKRDTLYIPVI